MKHVLPARYARGTHGNAGNAVRYRDRQGAGNVKLVALRLTEHGRLCVWDTAGATLVGASEGAPRWMHHTIRVPSASERVFRCDAGIGETPRLRLGL